MIEGYKSKNRVYILSHNSLAELDDFASTNNGKLINSTDNHAYKEFVHRAYVWVFNNANKRNNFIKSYNIKLWPKSMAIANQKYNHENSDDFEEFDMNMTVAEHLGLDKHDPWSKNKDNSNTTQRNKNVTGDSFNDREKKGDITIETIEGKKNAQGRIKLEDIETVVATIDRGEFFEETPDVDQTGKQVTK